MGPEPEVFAILHKISRRRDYFVHGDGLDRPLFRVQGGKAAFYHWGADGSLSFVSDQSGELIEKYSYSAYGERSVEDASGNAIPDSLIGNRYGYRGQMYHAATGLYWMRARWYEPKWGRFLTPDPIGLAGGQNRYMYVNASPTLFWDPFGLDPNSAGDDAPRGEMSALDTMDPSDAWRTGVVQGMKDRGAELGRTLWDQMRNPSWKYFTQNMFTPVGAYRGAVGLVGAVAGAGRDLSRGFDAFVRGDARGTGYYLNWGIGESALLAISGRGMVATGKLVAAGPAARAAPQMTADVDLLARYAPRIPTEGGGFFNIVTHAGPQSAYLLRMGEWLQVSHRSLARFIEGTPGYTGQPVRLIACSSGACQTGLAQNLANKLGVEVLAPTESVYGNSSGSFWTTLLSARRGPDIPWLRSRLFSAVRWLVADGEVSRRGLAE